MKYTVVKDFKDLMDSGHVYRAGDVFPRPDVDIGENRILELSTKNNKRGEVLIEPLEDLAPERKRKRGKKGVGADTQGNQELLHT